MKIKAKDVKKGDVILDRQVAPDAVRIAEVDHPGGGVVMIRLACRKSWLAYDAERELEMLE